MTNNNTLLDNIVESEYIQLCQSQYLIRLTYKKLNNELHAFVSMLYDEQTYFEGSIVCTELPAFVQYCVGDSVQELFQYLSSGNPKEKIQFVKSMTERRLKGQTQQQQLFLQQMDKKKKCEDVFSVVDAGKISNNDDDGNALPSASASASVLHSTSSPSLKAPQILFKFKICEKIKTAGFILKQKRVSQPQSQSQSKQQPSIPIHKTNKKQCQQNSNYNNNHNNNNKNKIIQQLQSHLQQSQLQKLQKLQQPKQSKQLQQKPSISSSSSPITLQTTIIELNKRLLQLQSHVQVLRHEIVLEKQTRKQREYEILSCKNQFKDLCKYLQENVVKNKEAIVDNDLQTKKNKIKKDNNNDIVRANCTNHKQNQKDVPVVVVVEDNNNGENYQIICQNNQNYDGVVNGRDRISAEQIVVNDDENDSNKVNGYGGTPFVVVGDFKKINSQLQRLISKTDNTSVDSNRLVISDHQQKHQEYPQKQQLAQEKPHNKQRQQQQQQQQQQGKQSIQIIREKRKDSLQPSSQDHNSKNKEQQILNSSDQLPQQLPSLSVVLTKNCHQNYSVQQQQRQSDQIIQQQQETKQKKKNSQPNIEQMIKNYSKSNTSEKLTINKGRRRLKNNYISDNVNKLSMVCDQGVKVQTQKQFKSKLIAKAKSNSSRSKSKSKTRSKPKSKPKSKLKSKSSASVSVSALASSSPSINTPITPEQQPQLQSRSRSRSLLQADNDLLSIAFRKTSRRCSRYSNINMRNYINANQFQIPFDGSQKKKKKRGQYNTKKKRNLKKKQQQRLCGMQPDAEEKLCKSKNKNNTATTTAAKCIIADNTDVIRDDEGDNGKESSQCKKIMKIPSDTAKVSKKAAKKAKKARKALQKTIQQQRKSQSESVSRSGSGITRNKSPLSPLQTSRQQKTKSKSQKKQTLKTKPSPKPALQPTKIQIKLSPQPALQPTKLQKLKKLMISKNTNKVKGKQCQLPLWFYNSSQQTKSLDNLQPFLKFIKQHSIKKLQNMTNYGLDQLIQAKTLTLTFHKILSVPPFPLLQKLVTLNLGYNEISQMQNLSNLKQLRQLNLEHNRISKIDNMLALTKLEILRLNQNRIRRIENVSHLRMLRLFDIGFNQLQVLQYTELYQLRNMKNIVVSGNRGITKSQYQSIEEQLQKDLPHFRIVW